MPIGHWSYIVLDELIYRGYGKDLFFSQRPYTRGEVANLVINTRQAIQRKGLSKEDPVVKWIGLLEEEFKDEILFLLKDERENELEYGFDFSLVLKGDKTQVDSELKPAFKNIRFDRSETGDPDTRATFLLKGDVQYKDYLALVSNFVADTDRRNDPTFRGQQFDGFISGYTFDYAYSQTKLGPIKILLGRDSLTWGPGRSGQLILSSTSPSFDLFKVQARFANFQGTSFLAFLNNELAPDHEIVDRLLYGHRLDWMPTEGIQLGASETVLVTGIGRGIELRFLNPFVLFYASQFDGDLEEGGRREDINVSGSIDWFISKFSRAHFYGEILVDDLQVEEGEFPSQLGFLFGSVLPDPFGFKGATFAAEYVRIQSFTYIQRGLETDYQHFDAPIGYELGPDSEQFKLSLSHQLSRDFRWSGSYSYRRRGEIRLNTETTREGNDDVPFPFGTVERRHIVDLGFNYRPSPKFSLDFLFSFSDVNNINNVSGDDNSFASLELNLSYYTTFASGILKED